MDLKEIQALIKFVSKSGAQEVSLETKGLLFLVWDNGDVTKIIN